jgi:hypothetical protein
MKTVDLKENFYMEKDNKNTEVNDTDKKLHISDVRYSYEDVEKHCNENGYYIGKYWFPFSDTK